MIKQLKKFRFLSKLSVFDYVSLLVMVLLLAAALSFFYRKSSRVTIMVKLTDENLLYGWNYPQNWYADNIKSGLVEKDVLGRVVSEITSVNSYSVDAARKAVFITIQLNALRDSRTGLYMVKGKNLSFGNSLKFDFNGLTFTGIVVKGPNESAYPDTQNVEKSVVVEVRGVEEEGTPVEPEVLQSILAGDEIKNNLGDVLVKVEHIELTPAIRISKNVSGDLGLRYDPFYKDARITLKVSAKKIGNEYFILDDYALRLGQKLPLVFPRTFINSTIISID